MNINWNTSDVADYSEVFLHCHNICNGVGGIGGWVLGDDENTHGEYMRKERKMKFKRLNAIFNLNDLIDNIKFNR